MTELTDDQAKAIAAEYTTEENFNFMDVLASRELPTEEVEIFLDEAAGMRIQKLTESLENTRDPDQLKVIEEQIDFQREKARRSRFVVHMRAITSDRYDEIIDAAAEEFPYEYKESRHPLTMAPIREIIPNEDRNTYFRTHYWASVIEKVVGPGGGEDANITPEWVGVLLAKAPLVALARIGIAAENLRMVGDWMDRLQTDDFLAKS